METLAKVVRRLRLGRRMPDGRRMSQADLARLASVDRSYIGHIENGRLKLPSKEILTSLAKALGTSTDELLVAAGYIQPAPPGEMYPVPVDSLAHYVATLPPDYQAKVRRIVDMITEDQDKRGWTGKPKKDSA